MDSLPSLVLAIAGYVFVLLTTAITIAFSRSSRTRRESFALLLAVAIPVHSSVWNNKLSRPEAGVLMFIWLQVLSSFDLFFHSKASFPSHYGHFQSKAAKDAASYSKRVVWGLRQSLNHRRLNTKHQVGIHPFDRENPGLVPSKSAFLVHRFITSILAFGAIHLFLLLKPPSPEIGYLQDHQDRINEFSLSLGAFPARIYLVASHNLTTYLDHKSVYALVSFLSVLLGIDSPADWPPNQGSLAEAYTMRRFWGLVSTLLPCERTLFINMTLVKPGTRPFAPR